MSGLHALVENHMKIVISKCPPCLRTILVAGAAEAGGKRVVIPMTKAR